MTAIEILSDAHDYDAANHDYRSWWEHHRELVRMFHQEWAGQRVNRGRPPKGPRMLQKRQEVKT